MDGIEKTGWLELSNVLQSPGKNVSKYIKNPAGKPETPVQRV
jgi:hypothetical protein